MFSCTGGTGTLERALLSITSSNPAHSTHHHQGIGRLAHAGVGADPLLPAPCRSTVTEQQHHHRAAAGAQGSSISTEYQNHKHNSRAMLVLCMQPKALQVACSNTAEQQQQTGSDKAIEQNIWF